KKYTLLTLFLKNLGVRPSGARRHAPIHLADVVAWLVVARFHVVDAAAAETRGVRGGAVAADAQTGARELARAQTQQNQFFEAYAYAVVRARAHRVLGLLRQRHARDQRTDQAIGRDALGLGLVGQQHAMTQHIVRDGVYVLRRDI